MSFSWCLSATCAASVLLGCGGRELASFTAPDAAAPQPDAGTAPPPPAPSTLPAVIVWQRPLSYYPVTTGRFFLAVSPDGARVAAGFDQQSLGGYQELATADGTTLTTRTGDAPTSRDRAWQRELRRSQVVDLATDAVLRDASGALEIAGDGRSTFSFSCADATHPTTVTRTDVDTGAATIAGGGTTSGCGYTSDFAAAVTGAGDRALFARGSSGTVFVADLRGSPGTLSSWQPHGPRPDSSSPSQVSYTAGAVLSIALAPDEGRVATIGADGALRLWSFPDLIQLMPDIPVRWTNAFTHCYCSPRSFAPAAWSADGTMLATPDDAGHTVVRRAGDGQILATMPDPDLKGGFSDPGDRGPILLAFAPDGGALAAMFDGVLAYYRLGAP
jgi:WD40 repeat protein